MNARSSAGLTALHLVGGGDGNEAVRVLLDAGARVTATSWPFTFDEWPFLPLLESFDRRSLLPTFFASGVMPLHMPAARGNDAIVQALLNVDVIALSLRLKTG